MATETCRSCGAEIIWSVTESGKAMPIDRWPHPDGNVVPVQPEPNVRVLKAGEQADGPRYRSHFATCPNADQHRRRTAS